MTDDEVLDFLPHRQFVQPRRWDRINAVVGSGNLPVNRTRRIRIITQVHRLESPLRE